MAPEYLFEVKSGNPERVYVKVLDKLSSRKPGVWVTACNLKAEPPMFRYNAPDRFREEELSELEQIGDLGITELIFQNI